MITSLRIDGSQNRIFFEVDGNGYFNVSVRNENGDLLFEKLCWELLKDIQFTIDCNKEITNPEIKLNPSFPQINTQVDYIQNKIYIQSDLALEVKFRLYETYNNKIIWRHQHNFSDGRIWYSPKDKLLKMGTLILETRDMWDNLISTNHIINKEFTFCHIPKTGGTSIKKVLNVRMSHDVFDKKTSNCFSFAFVRNPYDRFLSAYFFLLSGGLGLPEELDKAKYIGDDTDIDSFIKYKLHKSLSQVHLRPQNEYIPNGVDFLGRVENMKEDFDKICEIIGVDKIELPYENVTKKYNHTLTEEQKEIIYEIYKEDFIRFGYQK